MADKEAVSITNLDAFKKIDRAGQTICLKYIQKQPYLLAIEIDFRSNKVSIEFTGKVLGRDYPQLISKETIKECFNNINSLGLIHIQKDLMMNIAIVVKADITKDIKGVDTIRIAKYIKGNIINYNDFVCKRLKNGNLILEKNVCTHRLRRRITIYDKQKEMNKTNNKRYATENDLSGAFDNVCRFELNLNSAEQVRQALNITDNKLLSVLNAEANPILDFLNAAVKKSEAQIKMSDRKAWLTMLALKDCNYDLEAVEAKERSLHPKRGFNVKRTMEPYRAMMEQINNGEAHDYWQDVMSKLS